MELNLIYVDFQSLVLKSGFICQKVPSLMVDLLLDDGLVSTKKAVAIVFTHRKSEWFLFNVQSNLILVKRMSTYLTMSHSRGRKSRASSPLFPRLQFSQRLIPLGKKSRASSPLFPRLQFSQRLIPLGKTSSSYLVWRDVLSASEQSQLLFVDFELVKELLVIYLENEGSYLRESR